MAKPWSEWLAPPHHAQLLGSAARPNDRLTAAPQRPYDRAAIAGACDEIRSYRAHQPAARPAATIGIWLAAPVCRSTVTPARSKRSGGFFVARPEGGGWGWGSRLPTPIAHPPIEEVSIWRQGYFSAV